MYSNIDNQGVRTFSKKVTKTKKMKFGLRPEDYHIKKPLAESPQEAFL